MFYLRYLCLFAYSGVQCILCSVLCVLILCLMYPMFTVSLDCSFGLPLRYSLSFFLLQQIMMCVCIQSEHIKIVDIVVHSTRLFQLCVYMTLRLIIVLNENEVWRVLE